MAPTCQLCGGRIQKGDNGLCLPFCLGESCPPTLTLMSNTQFFLSSSLKDTLVSFKLLPRCWNSEGISLSMSVYGFFKRNCLGL